MASSKRRRTKAVVDIPDEGALLLERTESASSTSKLIDMEPAAPNSVISGTCKKKFKAPHASTSTSESENKESLTDDQKMRLGDIVKKFPQIWQLSHPLYQKPDATQAAWKNVARELMVPEGMCKKAWKSLKDSMRHFKNSKKQKGIKRKGKSGDSAHEESDAEQEQIEELSASSQELLQSWKFKDCLSFLITEKHKRKTLSSFNNVVPSSTEDNAVDVEAEDEFDDTTAPTNPNSMTKKLIEKGLDSSSLKVSNYSYAKNQKNISTPLEIGTTKLMDGIADLIFLRKLETKEAAQPELQYLSMYTNMDRMLKTLPPVIAEDLNMEIVTMIYSKMKEFQKIIVIDPTDL